MRYKIIFIFILLIFSFSFVDAAISSEDRAALLDSLEKYKDDTVRLNLILAVADSKMDLSDEPELRQKIIDAANNAGVDVSRYQNIVQGTVPRTLNQETVSDAQVQQQASSSGQQVSEQQKMQQPQSQLTPSTRSLSTGTVLILVLLIIVIVGIGWFVGRRKGNN